jgi:hypothetical protein
LDAVEVIEIGCLAVAAIGMAAKRAIEQLPLATETRHRIAMQIPGFLKSGNWNYAPIVLISIAVALWIFQRIGDDQNGGRKAPPPSSIEAPASPSSQPKYTKQIADQRVRECIELIAVLNTTGNDSLARAIKLRMAWDHNELPKILDSLLTDYENSMNEIFQEMRAIAEKYPFSPDVKIPNDGNDITSKIRPPVDELHSIFRAMSDQPAEKMRGLAASKMELFYNQSFGSLNDWINQQKKRLADLIKDANQP